MLDIRDLRRQPEQIQENFARRGLTVSVEEILRLDQQKLKLQTELEQMRCEKNRLSKEVAARKKDGRSAEDLLEQIGAMRTRLEDLTAAVERKAEELENWLERLPNLVDDDVSETNEVVCTFGIPPSFTFSPLDHIELCHRHGLVDYETAGSVAGSGYWIYRGAGARLEWALLNFCLAENQKAGYEMLMLPPLAKEICGFGAGQFPRFAGEVYSIAGSDLFLLPTAETVLVNLHRGQVLDGERLPLKYTAYTPCFRREGSRRVQERGMLRGHQFNKVELVQFAAQEWSGEAFAQILSQAQHLLEQLELHYRVVKLSAGECGFSMAKTCDLEVWLPAERTYLEVSSVSNARTFQSRRTNTRYRDSSGKCRYVHTLNGSGLATSRLFAALLEQNQTADGRIRIPQALIPWMGTEWI